MSDTLPGRLFHQARRAHRQPDRGPPVTRDRHDAQRRNHQAISDTSRLKSAMVVKGR